MGWLFKKPRLLIAGVGLSTIAAVFLALVGWRRQAMKMAEKARRQEAEIAAHETTQKMLDEAVKPRVSDDELDRVLDTGEF